MTSSYGRASTVEGRLTTDGGVPISGALLDSRPRPPIRALLRHDVSPRTGSDGRFVVRLSRGVSSRALRFAYRAHVGDAVPSATASLTLVVRASLSLKISPRTAHVGSTISFRGRLLGTPVPRGGKQVVLEARSPGGPWIEFNVVRTNTRGQFHARYRFKFPGPATYQFRVHSKPRPTSRSPRATPRRSSYASAESPHTRARAPSARLEPVSERQVVAHPLGARTANAPRVPHPRMRRHLPAQGQGVLNQFYGV